MQRNGRQTAAGEAVRGRRTRLLTEDVERKDLARLEVPALEGGEPGVGVGRRHGGLLLSAPHLVNVSAPAAAQVLRGLVSNGTEILRRLTREE